jgi:hypothetical protein
MSINANLTKATFSKSAPASIKKTKRDERAMPRRSSLIWTKSSATGSGRSLVERATLEAAKAQFEASWRHFQTMTAFFRNSSRLGSSSNTMWRPRAMMRATAPSILFSGRSLRGYTFSFAS